MTGLGFCLVGLLVIWFNLPFEIQLCFPLAKWLLLAVVACKIYLHLVCLGT